MKRSPMKRTYRNTGPDSKTRNIVYERDQSCCAVCSRSDCGTRLIPHHRLPRGRGGDNRLSNLVLLGDMGGCHDLLVESERSRADSSGWLVRTGEDPASKPLVWHGSWVHLTDAGEVEPCPLQDTDGRLPCHTCPSDLPGSALSSDQGRGLGEQQDAGDAA